MKKRTKCKSRSIAIQGWCPPKFWPPSSFWSAGGLMLWHTWRNIYESYRLWWASNQWRPVFWRKFVCLTCSVNLVASNNWYLVAPQLRKITMSMFKRWRDKKKENEQVRLVSCPVKLAFLFCVPPLPLLMRVLELLRRDGVVRMISDGIGGSFFFNLWTKWSFLLGAILLEL